MTEQSNNVMDDVISLAKRRGFVYQGSEIYGGLGGTWDYGPYGVALRHNIQELWWKRFVVGREDIFPVDASILMNPNVWEASGHVGGFADPLVEDIKTKKRYRADHVLEAAGIDPKGMTLQEMDTAIKEKNLKSADGNVFGEVRQFNMMFKTHVGAAEDEASISYLRPETAQGIFVNFKNILDSFHPKLPFGIGQIGKAFRNEIAPGQFIFRLRELKQMEIEYFVNPADPKRVTEIFEQWLLEQKNFLKDLGISESKIHIVEIPEADRAHYSKRSVDTEFDFPFGQKELLGLAYRTDFDLKAHTEASKVDLSYYDEDTKERFIPHCIEPTFGVDRLMLAVLTDAYTEDELGGEKRVYLKFAKAVAPIKAAVFPLLRNKPELVAKAREVFSMIKKEIPEVMFDDNGNIGKRYRRQDEIGTPVCITIDFDTLGETPELKDTVTVRDRDTGKQERIAVGELIARIK